MNTRRPERSRRGAPRKLVIRRIQGRAGALIDNQQHGIWNYFTRAEENSVWTGNMDGVIGAVNRSSFLWP